MDEPTPEEKRTRRFSDLEFAFIMIGVVQGVLLAFTAMILDGGFCGRMCLQAIVAYWLMVVWLCYRRGEALTTGDVFLIRTEFFLWLPVALMVERAVRSLSFGGI